MNLPPPVAGDRLDFGDVACWTAGEGPSLLLLHSVNAAASAAEVRPLFDTLKSRYRVFAPDLPGFGSSRREARAYTPRLMTDAVLATVGQIRRLAGEQPLPALAVSLGCEFLARAAAQQPDWFARLALVSPTGLNGTRARRAAPGRTRRVPGLLTLLSRPLWAQPLFAGLTRPGVVRYFLERTWGGKDIDQTMYQYAVLTARQPGAHHAPLAFLAGELFSADVLSVYESLRLPVWASHGTRGDFTDYRGQVHLAGRPNWRFTVFDGGAMPYFEHPQAFVEQFEAFLNER
jgi:pimeloyl-ACP methyl ester carboxylesterase